MAVWRSLRRIAERSAFVPQEWIWWFVAIPNIALGIAILVFRRPIREFVYRLFPRLSEDARFYVSRAVLLAGIVQLGLATCVLVFGTTNAIAVP
jgi:hypothetical protein